MSQHPISEERRARLLEMASDWVVRIQGGELSSEEFDAWIEWINASPDHREAFDDAQTMWQEMGELKRIQEPSSASVAADNFDPAQPIAKWRAREATRTKGQFWARPLAAAALVILGLGALVVWQSLPNHSTTVASHYNTVVGQHQTIGLPDGSSVELGAASVIKVHYSTSERRVDLEDGIAYFSVAHDAGRPFIVTADGGTVRAIGTEFSVHRTAQAVTVVVTDGLVEVRKPPAQGAVVVDEHRQPTAVQLPAGQQVTYSAGAGLQLPSETDVEAATAWRDGRLVLQGRTLDEAIDDINRYSRLPIELGSAEIGALEVSGYVRTDDVDAWLNGLETAFPVHVDMQVDRIVIEGR